MIAARARRFGVHRLLALSALSCALLLSARSADAAITFVAPALTLPKSSLTQTGSFEVYISSTASPQPSVGDFQFTLDLPNQQNATFIGGAKTIVHGYIFDGDSSPTPQISNNGDKIVGTDFTLTSGGVSLLDGAGLMRVDYSIAPNFVGTLPLTFETSASASSLNDGQGSPLAILFLNGSLSVVPEPGAACLFMLGAICGGLGLRRYAPRR
jgi:hypothetical protein